MKRSIARILVVGIVALALMLCGCSAGQGSGTSSASNSATKQITDAYGRTVAVPVNVKTCATVGSGARFVVYAGAQDKLIAITEKETPAKASRPYTVAWESLFSALPTTSNGNHLIETSVDAEALLALKPDVIISSRSAQECDQLQGQLGIPVVGISYQNQIFGDDVYKSIMVVGEALDTLVHAQGVVDQMKVWQADLAERTAGIPEAERPTCYVGAVNYKDAKSFTGTFAQYPPFEAVNIKNVADGVDAKGAFDVSLEQLGVWNPEFMFLNAANMELMQKEYQQNPDFFNNIAAFKNGNLYTQPSYNMNGTNIELAICDAYFNGATVYPAAFADVDLPTRYGEIFTVMLGLDIYPQLQAQGMDFKKLSFD